MYLSALSPFQKVWVGGADKLAGPETESGGWRQARLQAGGKVGKHPARDPASQRRATPTSQPASQRSNQPAKQSLDKSAIRKPFKQLWLPNTVSLSLSLALYLPLSLSLPPSLPLCLGNIQEEGTADGKQATRRELAGKPAIWQTRQATSEARVLTSSQTKTTAAPRCFHLSLSLCLYRRH